MKRLITGVSLKYDDIRYWLSNLSLRKAWQGVRDRFDAVIFCLLLLLVGIYSPKTLRAVMIDALKETK